MEATLDTLMETISRLDADAQDELRARMAHREVRSLRGGVSTNQQYLWDAVCDVIGRRIPLADYAKTYGVAKFKSRLSQINAYLDRSIRSNLSEPHRRAVAKAVLQCLHERLSRQRAEGYGGGNYHKVMLNRIDELGDAVEEAFPGYAAAGLLDRVVLMAA